MSKSSSIIFFLAFVRKVTHFFCNFANKLVKTYL